jgi:hypothetical protein
MFLKQTLQRGSAGGFEATSVDDVVAAVDDVVAAVDGLSSGSLSLSVLSRRGSRLLRWKNVKHVGIILKQNSVPELANFR